MEWMQRIRRADGRGAGVVVIAELGVNHDGDVGRAVELVRVAARAGVDGVKVQWFSPERLLSREARLAGYQEGVANDVAEMLSGLTLTADEVMQVRAAAKELGLAFVATLFSPGDAAEVKGFGVDAVKVASPDAVNPAVLGAAASVGAALLVSTGTCDLDEVAQAAELVKGHAAGGCLLQCVSAYPLADEDAGLGGIRALEERYGLAVGYSDHTAATDTGGLAVAAGAVVLEKHLTYDRGAKGPDHAASLDGAGMAEYVRQARRAAAMVGRREKRVLDVERDVREVSRQSVCVTRDMAAGEVVRAEDVTVKRPGTGIPAMRLGEVIGRRVKRAVRGNELLREEDLG